MLTFAFSNKYGILYGTWPYRLTARTRAFQALNQGSIPCRVTFFTKNLGLSGVFCKKGLGNRKTERAEASESGSRASRVRRDP